MVAVAVVLVMVVVVVVVVTDLLTVTNLLWFLKQVLL
jgi:hypothetical protein